VKDAQTKVTTYDDTKDGFKRTALIIDTAKGGHASKGGSVDLVDVTGKRLAQVNINLCDDGTLIVDVIDVDKQYTCNRAIGFINGDMDDVLIREVGLKHAGDANDVRVRAVGCIEFSNDASRVKHLKDKDEPSKKSRSTPRRRVKA
jgi:hypothetical protein